MCVDRCRNTEDEELWDTDPEEYVRKNLESDLSPDTSDAPQSMFSSRKSAMAFISAVCTVTPPQKQQKKDKNGKVVKANKHNQANLPKKSKAYEKVSGIGMLN